MIYWFEAQIDPESFFWREKKSDIDENKENAQKKNLVKWTSPTVSQSFLSIFSLSLPKSDI